MAAPVVARRGRDLLDDRHVAVALADMLRAGIVARRRHAGRIENREGDRLLVLEHDVELPRVRQVPVGREIEAGQQETRLGVLPRAIGARFGNRSNATDHAFEVAPIGGCHDDLRHRFNSAWEKGHAHAAPKCAAASRDDCRTVLRAGGAPEVRDHAIPRSKFAWALQDAHSV